MRQASLSCLIGFIAAAAASAQTPAPHHAPAAGVIPRDIACVPVAQRGDKKLGCFVTHTEVLGRLPSAPLYWHIYEYPTRAAAQEAKGKQSSVVESQGQIWSFTVAEANWNASAGKRVARVGPLPVDEAASYTAQYMEATFMPGMKSAAHRHAGPEAWYVLAGEQCLETPGHKQIVRAGETGIVPEGPPMQLSGIGTSERRALVLILHDSMKPMTLPAVDWTPAGLCDQP